jgi:hypothetical protein
MIRHNTTHKQKNSDESTSLSSFDTEIANHRLLTFSTFSTLWSV